MFLPLVQTQRKKTQNQIISFSGLNFTQQTSDGELSHSENLSSSLAPSLSQRDAREIVATFTSPTGLHSRGALFVVDGTNAVYDGEIVGQVEEGEKLFATINTKIVILPDKVIFDTATKEFKKVGTSAFTRAAEDREPGEPSPSFTSDSFVYPDAWYSVSQKKLTKNISLYTSSAVIVYDSPSQSSPGSQKFNGELVRSDTAANVNTGEYFTINESVVDMDETYRVISKTVNPEGTSVDFEVDVGHFDEIYPPLTGFNVGDTVTISGAKDAGNNGNHIVSAVEERKLTFEGTLTASEFEENSIDLWQGIPNFECMCESDNRIWGASGSTIYASALGEPDKFLLFDGLSTDSYAVAVGTDGGFTGCVGYSSSVLFFKEDFMHRVVGKYPAQYELYTYTVPGVQKGSEKSLVIVNETLFYKSQNGVYAYNGGTPVLISENFGNQRYGEAVAGSDGTKLYISMKESEGEYNLFVFDPVKGFWLREDSTQVSDFASLHGRLYFMKTDTKELVRVGTFNYEDDEEEAEYPTDEPIAWSATLCQMDEVILNKKGYSRLIIRAKLGAKAWLKVEVATDNGRFKQVFLTHNEYAKTVNVPILPVRCDNFQIRLSGEGSCMIKSVVREFSIGSEL